MYCKILGTPILSLALNMIRGELKVVNTLISYFIFLLSVTLAALAWRVPML
jgi:hypothetical protein